MTIRTGFLTLALALATLTLAPSAAAADPAAARTAYLASALDSWTYRPRDPEERGEHDTAVEQASREIERVAYDPAERPLFRGNRGRGQTALLLASIAAHETGLVPRILRGDCRGRECDGGEAVGLMQIHPGKWGIALTATGFRMCGEGDHYWSDATKQYESAGCLERRDLLHDEQAAVRIALHILRQGGIGAYTGEGDDAAPAATRRLSAARTFAARYPPPLD